MLRIIMLLLVTFAAGCDSPERLANPETDSIRVDQRMGAPPDPGFERALEPRAFEFPRDHGAHPGFATEWWYFTGNLYGPDGRRFGYQFTLFRVGLEPGQPVADSDWRTNQVYMGHLAVSDIANRRHYSTERLARAAAGLAGGKVPPLHVWLGPWSISGSQEGIFPLKLAAATTDFGITLTLQSGNRPMVLQGDRGLSLKGAAPGNASYYYSYTRLPTRGEIHFGGERFEVTGNSWFDREWSSSALAADQAGWDWFALQFDDGRDLMFYRMRDRQGLAQSFSAGVLVDKGGGVIPLSLDQVDLNPTRHWQSGQGASYPVAWRLQAPDLNLDLQVEAAFDNQEMPLTVRYWEGAVDVSGSHTGVGYLELSGYAQ